jgi:hypothetical protein
LLQWHSANRPYLGTGNGTFAESQSPDSRQSDHTLPRARQQELSAKTIFVFLEIICQGGLSAKTGFCFFGNYLPRGGLSVNTFSVFSKILCRVGLSVKAVFVFFLKILCRGGLSAKAPSKMPGAPSSSFTSPRGELTLGKFFAECGRVCSRQRRLCQIELSREVFAESGSRQSLCRESDWLCRAFLALGKEGESGDRMPSVPQMCRERRLGLSAGGKNGREEEQGARLG